ncbi:MAG: hypothetical protein JWQ90_3264 [Hydrocarboniphaga sp.]|uniref:DUF3016 domain-containing protein n=1 Tax=Hydrocarboniphaga sp. TaxID=2033016 RepID=UPI00261433B7|nr:DUF3016 domain-containing protein [Hydrocarboniphaga sp.]MDB5970814.1 hypothetical protein [Hydrocarboniphaga sp.]
MNRMPLKMLLLTAAVAAPIAATQAATVTVEFKDPDHYVDAGNRGADRDRNFKTLTTYLQKLGERLPAQQTLAITVLALDLAGQYEPWRSPPGNEDIRYLRSSTWPSMQLHYRLGDGDKTVGEGEDSIADMNYQLGRQVGSESTLYYDKQMLKTWFDKRFPVDGKP